MLIKFRYLNTVTVMISFALIQELCHGVLSYFGHVQNHLQIEQNLKIVTY